MRHKKVSPFAVSCDIFRILALLLPGGVFFWLLPKVSKLTIGNDYPIYSLQAQLEILFSFKSGSFPLLVPGPEGALPIPALTLGGLFHPQTYLSSFVFGFWEGRGLLIITLFRLVSLGVGHLLLYLLFRSLSLPRAVAFVVASIPIYNMRVLDSFRYGASLENYLGFIFLVCSVFSLRMRLLAGKKKLLAWYSVVFSSYLLIVGGHTQWMFLLFLGFLALAPLIPSLISLFRGEQKTSSRSFWFHLGGAIVFGLLLASPYTLSFYFDFLTANSTRGKMPYLDTLAFTNSFFEMISVFLSPFQSEVHSSFSAAPLLLVSLFLPPTCLALGIKTPKPIWVLWMLVFFLLAYSLGSLTPLHQLMYRLPFFGSFRIPGRFNLPIPLFLSLILAWALRFREITKRAVIFSCALTALALVLYSLVYPASALSAFTPVNINKMPSFFVDLEFALSIMVLLFFICSVYFETKRIPWRQLLFLSFYFIYICFLFRFGTWVQNRPYTKTYDQLISEKKKGAFVDNAWGSGLALHAVSRFKEKHSGHLPPLAYLSSNFRITNSKSTALEGFINQDKILSVFFPVSELAKVIAADLIISSSPPGSVSLEFISFNLLRFRAVTKTPTFLVLGVPLGRDHWSVAVAGNPGTILDSNGGYPAVYLPKAGEWSIEFKYHSFAMSVGIALSLLTTLVLIALCPLFKRSKYLLILCSLLMVLTYCLYHRSLYTGRNWGMEYSWPPI